MSPPATEPCGSRPIQDLSACSCDWPGRPPGLDQRPCSVVRGFLDQTDAQDPTGEQRSAEAVEAVITELLHR